jgi:hypothetical protein
MGEGGDGIYHNSISKRRLPLFYLKALGELSLFHPPSSPKMVIVSRVYIFLGFFFPLGYNGF